jgi:NAD(P)-dependent dehydrogenase (short-subunit alcohol dehydrogenase family)
MAGLFDLTGKVAVVTGGGRGLGEMMASGLIDAGCIVWISSRKIDDLQTVADRLGERCIPFAADLSGEAGARALAEAVGAKHQHVDILVNNAGASWGAPLDEFPAEIGFDKVMNINVKGVFATTQAFLPLLRVNATAEDPARIVNIGSVEGMEIPMLPAWSYSASKAAVHQMTRHLAKELAPQDITVNAIAPGMFPSKMTSFLGDEGYEEIASSTPRKRIGTPQDIQGTLIYLCSRAGAYATGVILPLDGGLATLAG